MDSSVDDFVELEVNMYLGCCRLAAKHDDMEGYYRAVAHRIFYHIQELRTTQKASVLPKEV